MSKFLRVQSKRLYLKCTGREMQVPPRKPASSICITEKQTNKKNILECQKSSIFIIFLWILKGFVATWYYREKTMDPN